MSSPTARKVVVGVGLLVAFGIGVSILMAPAIQGTQSQAAHSAPGATAPTDQTAVNPPAADPADSAASARDAAAAAPGGPPAAASPGPSSNPPLARNSPATSQPTLNGTDSSGTGNSASSSTGNGASGSSAPSNDTNAPKPRQGSRHGVQSTAAVKKPGAALDDSSLRNARAESGAAIPSSPPAPSDAVASADVAPAASAPAPDASTAAAPADSLAGAANAADLDGRITAQVRSSIANLAPGSNIDVKASSGLVALAGSVPSQDVVEQARQAAQQVPGVRQVDTSALLVANR